MEGGGESRQIIDKVLELADAVTVQQFSAPVAAADSVTVAGAGAGTETGTGTGTGTGTEPVETLDNLKADTLLSKYAKMASMGVPHGSVQAKMKLDGIEAAQANRLLRALGIDVSPSGSITGKAGPGTGPGAGAGASILGALSAGPGGLRAGPGPGAGPGAGAGAGAGAGGTSRRATVQLQNVQWTMVPADRLRNSVWASNADSGEGRVGKGNANANGNGNGNGNGNSNGNSNGRAHVDGDGRSLAGDDEILDEDLEELEKLFGAKPKPAPTAYSSASAAGSASNRALQGGAGGGSGGGAGVQASAQLKVLDAKRAQNLVIGLAQYKNLVQVGGGGTQNSSSSSASFDAFGLLRAVCSLDPLSGRLQIDHLENLVSLLPTPSEMKRLPDLASSAHPAEAFLRTAASFFPELPRRLQCFTTCFSFASNAASAAAKAKAMVAACKEVLSSDKLERLLKKMLAVGNVMNQGTFRGQASGFTVDSLLRMIQTKGKSSRQISC